MQMRMRHGGETFEIELRRVSLTLEPGHSRAEFARQEMQLPPATAEFMEADGGAVQRAPPPKRQRVELEIVHDTRLARVHRIGIGDYA